MVRTTTSSERSRKLRLVGLCLIAVVAIMSSLVLVNIVRADAVIYTDKPDYSPEEIVTIYGSGFSPTTNVYVTVTRPDGSVNPPPWNVTSDDFGAFTTTYQLDGITGDYRATATDGVNSAMVTFHDTRASSTTVTCGSSTVNVPTSCTATVTDTAGSGGATAPTGSVALQMDSSPSGSCSLSSISSSSSRCSISFTPGSGSAGSHTITASYMGDHKPSSGTTTLTISKRSSSTILSCSPTQAAVSSNAACTVTVTDSTSSGTSITPTGSVSFAITPSGSGSFNSGSCTLISGSCSVTYTPSAAGSQTISATYGSDSNHNGSSRTATITADSTGPVILASPSPSANANGWNNGPVTISWSVSDPETGIASSSGCTTTTISSETSGTTLTCTATNGASMSSLASVTIRIDKTPPAITGSRSPDANANGWTNVAVTVTFMCSDTLSGVDVGPVIPQTVSSEGSAQSRTADCTDKAGNSASATVGGINIDLTAPSISGSGSPEPNANGWNNGPITVTFTCTDGLSGLDSGPVSPQLISADGSAQSRTGACTDRAGNTVSATVSGLNIDQAPPIIAGSKYPAPNVNDWNNGTVTVTFTCTDSLSGVNTGPLSPQLVSTEGAGQSRTATCQDKAGNTASATVGDINIDLTPPVVSVSVSPGSNGNSWNNVDVTVTFTCTDSLSGVNTQPVSPQTVTTEGANQTRTAGCTDNAGNASTATVGGINIDKTPPDVSASRSPAANSFGWNNGPVTVILSCSDALSGVDVTPTSPQTVTSEGGGQSVNATCIDMAGNSANATIGNIQIDSTPPNISGSRSPDPNSNGWNNVDVTVGFTCTDNLSGVDSYSGPTTLTGEGEGQSVTGTCVDKAGNSASSVVGNINIDKTNPTLSGSRSPPANGFGWNSVDVTVHFECSDPVSKGASSGVDAVTSDQIASAEGAGQSVTGACSDRAGNSASTTVGDINIDRTPPAISGSQDPAPNGNGWNNGQVTVTFTCTDSLSGRNTVTDPIFLTSEGSGQAAVGECDDFAGNTASSTVEPINIDLTPPSISGSASPDANANGWNNGPVTVHFDCGDTLSGFSSVTPDHILSSEGKGQAVNGTCYDRASNSNSATVSNINIDLTQPKVTGSRSPAADSFGWNNENVTVIFTCSDALSGVDTCTSPTVLSSEGAGQLVIGSVTDLAGNVASVAVDNINIDKTAPTISDPTSPAPNGNGWNNGAVTVHFDCTDVLSGLAPGSPPADVLLTNEGANQSVTGTCLDRAGNSASAIEGNINIDLTMPAITGSRSPLANAFGWSNVKVTVSFVCTDALSGVDSSPGSTTLGQGGGQYASGTCTDRAGNSASTTVTGINIDLTTPTLSGLRSPPAGSNGWNNNDVTVTFTCSDNLSGVNLPPVSPQTVSSEGAGQSRSASCADKAGNSISATVGTINIDKTPPSTSIQVGSPSFGSNPVYVSDSTLLTLTGVDQPLLSGVDKTFYGVDDPSTPNIYMGSFKILSRGTHTILWRSLDRAGNLENMLSLSVTVDATLLTYTGSLQGQYSDAVSLKAILVEMSTQARISGKSIGFVLGAQSSSGTTDLTGTATALVVLNQPAGSYSLVASFAGDSVYSGSSASATFKILKEDATVSYAGDTVVPTTSSTITFRATVQEAQDGYLGDLSKAKVIFRIYTTDASPLLVQTVGPIPVSLTSTPGLGVATVQIPNMQENTYVVTVSLDPTSNPYYTAPGSDPAPLTVYQPNGSYVTGGGWIVDSYGSHGNFGFVVRYNKNGQPQGHAVYIYRIGGLDYVIKSNSWIGFAVDGTHAYFQAKATLQIYDPSTGLTISSDGNYQFRVDVYDNTGTGVNNGIDTYQITVWDKNGIVYHQAGGSLMGGQIMVHDASKSQ